MKKQKLIVLGLGLLLIPAAAQAENLTGRVTGVDPSRGTVTLVRADTSETVTLNVRDRASISALRHGATITVDANNRGGNWEASSAGSALNNQISDRSVPQSAANSLSANRSAASGTVTAPTSTKAGVADTTGMSGVGANSSGSASSSASSGSVSGAGSGSVAS